MTGKYSINYYILVHVLLILLYIFIIMNSFFCTNTVEHWLNTINQVRKSERRRIFWGRNENGMFRHSKHLSLWILNVNKVADRLSRWIFVLRNFLNIFFGKMHINCIFLQKKKACYACQKSNRFSSWESNPQLTVFRYIHLELHQFN